ncbi:MAG: alpha/beta hydrolase [Pseudobutyrivibrio sp.]|nr:alpha/beta hydrolase [Pseudobutyrivibrio sp.]
MSKISDEIRRDWKAGDAIRDAGLTTPDSVKRFDDICYGDDKNWQLLDVYRPKDAMGKLPVIVSVHGGGWVYGDKELYQFYCMDLARRGFAVVNFTYRLAPEFKFPASLIDTKMVFEFVYKNANEYGFDTDNVFALGDSAGAHLLSIFALACTDANYGKRVGVEIDPGLTPRALALNCGKYMFEKEEDEMHVQLMADLLPNKGTAEELDMLSSAKYIGKDFPPTFLMTCTDDFLKDQAGYMVTAMMASQVPFEFHYYGTATNLLPHVFMCDMRSKDGQICNDEECRYFKDHMK